jgi:hypothetical protein
MALEEQLSGPLQTTTGRVSYVTKRFIVLDLDELVGQPVETFHLDGS